MFAEAQKLAQEYTKPVLIAVHRASGQLVGGIGAFVVINDEGWIVTAYHQIKDAAELKQQHTSYHAWRKECDAITQSQEKMSDKERNRRIRRLKCDPAWVQSFAYLWAFNGVSLVDIRALPDGDLALGRLEPFDADWVKRYPVFKDPATGMDCGRSLCRLGFPFHDMKPTVDAQGNFEIDKPAAFFSIEGIYARNVQVSKAAAGYRVAYLETSSPGLRGQSGGPVFDTHGTIWGIQSQTKHYPLGFSPPVPNGRRGEVEHQFLNVGWAIHPETLIGFMDEHNIRYEKSAY